jgi:hypothetical protein
MGIRESFLQEIDAFVTETGLAETTLGGRAVKDSRFVARVREGRGVSLESIERVREFMQDYRAEARRLARVAVR